VLCHLYGLENQAVELFAKMLSWPSRMLSGEGWNKLLALVRDHPIHASALLNWVKENKQSRDYVLPADFHTVLVSGLLRRGMGLDSLLLLKHGEEKAHRKFPSTHAEQQGKKEKGKEKITEKGKQKEKEQEGDEDQGLIVSWEVGDLVEVLKLASFCESSVEGISTVNMLTCERNLTGGGFVSSAAREYFLKYIRMLCVNMIEELKQDAREKIADKRVRLVGERKSNGKRLFMMKGSGLAATEWHFGDVVTLIPASPTLMSSEMIGIIMESAPSVIVEIQNAVPREATVTSYKVHYRGNATTFLASLDALAALCTGACANQHIGPVLWGGETLAPIEPVPPSIELKTGSLNPSQFAALSGATKNLMEGDPPIMLVQGPPGKEPPTCCSTTSSSL